MNRHVHLPFSGWCRERAASRGSAGRSEGIRGAEPCQLLREQLPVVVVRGRAKMCDRALSVGDAASEQAFVLAHLETLHPTQEWIGRSRAGAEPDGVLDQTRKIGAGGRRA